MSETEMEEIECKERFCGGHADVTLINNHTAEEKAYCLDHAEEALSGIGQLNVGEPL